MNTISKESNIIIYWKIWRGANKTSEDFNNVNTNLKVFLVGTKNTYSLDPTIDLEIDPGYKVLKVEVNPKTLALDTGIYDIRAIWSKNGGRDFLKSSKSGVLSIDDKAAEVETETIRLVSYVESFGSDGLTAYEIAVIRGLNVGISSEVEWVGDEAQRIKDEDERVKAEDIRKSQETTRQTQETTRQSQETTREAQETTRQSQETTRQTQETTREGNETTRRNNEDTRKSNETTRETREAVRERNESTRESNEATRENREAVRESNESTRKSNEATRLTRFEEAQEQRAEIFNRSESDMRRAFEESEQNRGLVFSAAEEERERQETIRQENENTRLTQESVRQQAEQIRIDTFDENERERIATFETNEATRQTNETTRIANEEERIANEAIRQESYLDKVPTSAIVQETGDGKDLIMSQKAVSKELAELESQISKTYNGNYGISDFTDNYMIDVNGNIIYSDYFRVLKRVPVSEGDIVKTIGVISDNPNVCCIAAYSANGDFLLDKSVFVQFATTYQYEVEIGVAYLAFGTLLTTSNVSVIINRPTSLENLHSDVENLHSDVENLHSDVDDSFGSVEALSGAIKRLWVENFAASDFIDNYYINTNGDVVQGEYNRVLTYVPVVLGDIINLNGVVSDNSNVCCIAAYSVSGEFLSEKSIFYQADSTYQYTVSEGVAYLSFCTLKTTSISITLTNRPVLGEIRNGVRILISNDFVRDNTFIETNGTEVYNSSYNTTDFILIRGVKNLSVNAVMGNQYGGGIAFYDKSRSFISSIYNQTPAEVDNYVVNLADIPANTWYCKVQGKSGNTDILVNYTIAPNVEQNALLGYDKQVLWQREKDIYSAKSDALATNEYLILEDSPNIRNSYVIQASAIVHTMGRLRISKGTGAYAAGIVDIDATNVYEYNPNNPTAYNTYEHGIEISDFIRITIKVDAMPMTAQITGKASLILESVGGRYEKEIMWNGGNNNVVFMNTSANLGISELTMSVKGKDVWYFGDSYLDFWTPFAYKMGANNILIDGFSGRASEAAYFSLLREIKVNLPKKIVWGMGMNDGDSSDAVNATWKYYYEQLVILCNKYGIEPILVTIPNTPTVTNYYKNEIIRASGYRYLDIAAIMGANEKGSAWYSGLLSGDNVHPRELGAEIIATYIVAQLAEIVT